jgi:hypothetical protein
VLNVRIGMVALAVSIGLAIALPASERPAVAATRIGGTRPPALCRVYADMQKSLKSSSSHHGKGPDLAKMRVIAQDYEKAARSATDPAVADALKTMGAFFGKVAKAKSTKQADALLRNSPDLATYSKAQSVFSAYYTLNCPVPAASSG